MANTRRNGHYNQQVSHGHNAYGMKGTYLDGNTVRRVQTFPQAEPERETLPVSRTARRNRERAQSMSMVFVLFLSVDLQQVKKTAMERLGMKYPSESQVVTYQLPRGSHVRQYQDVPEAE